MLPVKLWWWWDAQCTRVLPRASRPQSPAAATCCQSRNSPHRRLLSLASRWLVSPEWGSRTGYQPAIHQSPGSECGAPMGPWPPPAGSRRCALCGLRWSHPQAFAAPSAAPRPSLKSLLPVQPLLRYLPWVFRCHLPPVDFEPPSNFSLSRYGFGFLGNGGALVEGEILR